MLPLISQRKVFTSYKESFLYPSLQATGTAVYLSDIDRHQNNAETASKTVCACSIVQRHTTAVMLHTGELARKV